MQKQNNCNFRIARLAVYTVSNFRYTLNTYKTQAYQLTTYSDTRSYTHSYTHSYAHTHTHTHPHIHAATLISFTHTYTTLTAIT